MISTHIRRLLHHYTIIIDQAYLAWNSLPDDDVVIQWFHTNCQLATPDITLLRQIASFWFKEKQEQEKSLHLLYR